MITKMSDWTMTPGMLLIIPQKQEGNGSTLLAELRQHDKDSGIGVVVKYTPRFPVMPDTYDNGMGGIATRPKKDKAFEKGDLIMFKRVSSTVYVLFDEDGQEAEYRAVDEQDIAGLYTPEDHAETAD